MAECEHMLTQNFVSELSATDQSFLGNSVIKSLLKHRNENNIYNQRSLKMYEFLKNITITEDPCIFHGQEWVDDSCYIDSVLMCLLSVPDLLIDEILDSDDNNFFPQQVLGELIKIQRYIRHEEGEKTCKGLRELLRKNDQFKKFATGTGSAEEFLHSIMNFFSRFQVCKKIYTHVIKTRNKESEIIDENVREDMTTPIQIIEYRQLENYDEPIKISNFLKKISINSNDEIVEIEEEDVISTPFLVFDINRFSPISVLNTKGILPEQIIYTKDDTILELSGIVIYGSRHYTCCFSCRKIWYYYNDLQSDNKRIVKIGSYEDLVTKLTRIFTHGTLYFYSQLFANLA